MSEPAEASTHSITQSSSTQPEKFEINALGAPISKNAGKVEYEGSGSAFCISILEVHAHVKVSTVVHVASCSHVPYRLPPASTLKTPSSVVIISPGEKRH